MKRFVSNENYILNSLCGACQFKRKSRHYRFCSCDENGTIWDFPEDVWYELIELADIIRTYIKN